MGARALEALSDVGQFGRRTQQERGRRDRGKHLDACERLERVAMASVIEFFVRFEGYRQAEVGLGDSTNRFRMGIVDLVHAMIEVSRTDEFEQNRDRNLTAGWRT